MDVCFLNTVNNWSSQQKEHYSQMHLRLRTIFRLHHHFSLVKVIQDNTRQAHTVLQSITDHNNQLCHLTAANA